MIPILANVISSVGLVLFAISALLKKKNNILYLQCCNHILSGIAQILVKGYSGMVQEFVSLVRNLFIIWKKNNIITSILFIITGLVLGIIFNQNGWWGILPIFASLEYSIVILIPNVKELPMKISLCISNICWAIYGFGIGLYSITIFNSITCLLSFISIIRIIFKNNSTNVEKNNL